MRRNEEKIGSKRGSKSTGERLASLGCRRENGSGARRKTRPGSSTGSTVEKEGIVRSGGGALVRLGSAGAASCGFLSLLAASLGSEEACHNVGRSFDDYNDYNYDDKRYNDSNVIIIRILIMVVVLVIVIMMTP